MVGVATSFEPREFFMSLCKIAAAWKNEFPSSQKSAPDGLAGLKFRSVELLSVVRFLNFIIVIIVFGVQGGAKIEECLQSLADSV